MIEETKWCVVHAKPAMELLAKQSIIEAGHRAYCPMQKHILTGHRPGNGESVLLPLFPRYLFAEMPGGHWYAIRNARGVSKVILSADSYSPATLLPEMIEELRSRENAAEFDEKPASEEVCRWKPGDHVRLAHESWGDVLAVVAGIAPHNRVKVLFEFLGRPQMPVVRADQLVAAQ